MMPGIDLFNQVVEVTKDFMGPASEQFVARQMQTHLKKKPDQLDEEDLEELARWIKVSVAILTDDTEAIRKYSENIVSLNKKAAVH